VFIGGFGAHNSYLLSLISKRISSHY